MNCRTLMAGLCLLLPACTQQMADQPNYRPLEPTEFFEDGRSARPVVAGTVARGQLRIDSALYEGRNAQGQLVEEFPFTITPEVMKRGQQRYDIFCAVCHGQSGHGDGRIVQRGFTKPPNYVTEGSRGYKLKNPDKEKLLIDVPVGYIYEVITKGYGAMPDHAAQIPVKDRWAITAYVRALQYSQSETLRKQLAPAKKGDKP